PLAFGYAGQKRMQRLLAAQMQRISDTRRLGIRFVALVPKQFIVGTTIAELGSRAYADEANISQESFMERSGPQLMPEAVAEAIVRVARGEAGAGSLDVGVTGRGIEEGNER